MKHLEEMKTQKAWKAHFQGLFVRHKPPHRFEGVEEQEWLYLTQTYYPKPDKLEGSGISHFELRDYRKVTYFLGEPVSERFSRNDRHMWVVRLDGSEACFSWNKAIRCARGRGSLQVRRERSLKSGETGKFRYEVREQIFMFKEMHVGKTCPVTSEVLTQQNSVVHHDPGFEEVLEAFRQHTGITELQGDVEAQQAWRSFHEKNAGLVLLTEKGHYIAHGKQVPEGL